MVDLRTIEIVYLHGPHRPERKEHMEKMLKEAGLQGECHVGYCDKGRHSGVLGLIELFKKRLEGEFRPFICLEDDCNTTPWFRHVIDIPEDADGVYLGISKWSMHPHFDQAIMAYQGGPLDQCPEVVRLVNMLSNHAVLFLTRRWAESCLADYQKTATWESPDYDILQSRNQFSFNIYALKRPVFYQCKEMGGHEEATLFILG
jgi:hypothetical protein